MRLKRNLAVEEHGLSGKVGRREALQPDSFMTLTPMKGHLWQTES